ncbi:hypothetical protein [Escherichia coli]|nr:hypothetical protein [Escherichia coli]
MPRINGQGKPSVNGDVPSKKNPDVVAHIDAIWDELAIFNNGKSA